METVDNSLQERQALAAEVAAAAAHRAVSEAKRALIVSSISLVCSGIAGTATVIQAATPFILSSQTEKRDNVEQQERIRSLSHIASNVFALADACAINSPNISPELCANPPMMLETEATSLPMRPMYAHIRLSLKLILEQSAYVREHYHPATFMDALIRAEHMIPMKEEERRLAQYLVQKTTEAHGKLDFCISKSNEFGDSETRLNVNNEKLVTTRTTPRQATLHYFVPEDDPKYGGCDSDVELTTSEKLEPALYDNHYNIIRGTSVIPPPPKVGGG